MSPYKKRLFLLMGLTMVLALLAMLPPLITKTLVDDVFTDGNTDHLFGLGLAMAAIPICSATCAYIQQTGIAYLGQRFVFDIRAALYNHLLHLSLRFFGKHSTGKIVYRLMGDSGTVQNMLTGQSITIVSDLISSSFAIVATFYLNWRLAIVVLLLIVLFILNYKFTLHPMVIAGRANRQAFDRLSGGIQNRLVANLAVKTFGAEARENQTFQVQSMTALAYERDQDLAANRFSMNVALIQNAGNALLFFLGCAMVLSDSMSYGSVSAFNAYAMQLLWPAVRFSNLVSQLEQVNIATDRLFEIFDQKPEVANPENPIPCKHIRGKVDLEHVMFQYVEGKPVLRDITIHCKPGDTTALIGPTGCGKSTVLNLLMRFYDITDGELKIDDMDIRKLNLHDLRRQFGIVLQESLLFGVSIRENIRYSRPDATDEEIENAAKTAEIHDFIMSLPDKYETLVGDFGVELSVGQKQRINIARAICANPAILIMDEATSSLDSDSELAIQKAMAKVLAGRTSFVVAHRLSTIKNATRIILLDKGYIVEQGTHEELMAIPNGRYHELYTKHMGAGVIEEEEN
ncbi:MAG: ABC transporter ATP-binding protein [Victivallales bacterium]|nr:ABC transporter ATP-binding protein [Victivallales bacterium]